jgi:hypothetical protein
MNECTGDGFSTISNGSSLCTLKHVPVTFIHSDTNHCLPGYATIYELLGSSVGALVISTKVGGMFDVEQQRISGIPPKTNLV